MYICDSIRDRSLIIVWLHGCGCGCGDGLVVELVDVHVVRGERRERGGVERAATRVRGSKFKTREEEEAERRAEEEAEYRREQAGLVRAHAPGMFRAALNHDVSLLETDFTFIQDCPDFSAQYDEVIDRRSRVHHGIVGYVVRGVAGTD